MNTPKDHLPPDHQAGPSHFKGKGPLEHVVEVQAQSVLAAAEVHGTELPGSLSAACDAAREAAVVMALMAVVALHVKVPMQALLVVLEALMCGWMFWKAGRSAWLGWSRLERLHRILEQERWEIEHHRQQERDELRVLYAAKGFEGKLLEDVLDVLMADNDRLLKVMVEEELGLSLQSHEHPLKQGVGAGLGVLLAAAVCLPLFWLWAVPGLLGGAAVIVGGMAAVSALGVHNDVVPAVVWNLGLAVLAIGCVYYLLEFSHLLPLGGA